jgi:hypothetical protein
MYRLKRESPLIAPRSILVRTVPLLIVGLVLSACGSAAASLPANATSAPPTVGATATATQAGTAAAPSVAAGGGGLPDCGTVVGSVKFTFTGGFPSERFCGPARATMTMAGATGSFTNGFCETTVLGFYMAVGAQTGDTFKQPPLADQPDVLLVNVYADNGGGPVTGVFHHQTFLLHDVKPVHLAADSKSGTFAGTTLRGVAISGSFTCGD